MIECLKLEAVPATTHNVMGAGRGLKSLFRSAAYLARPVLTKLVVSDTSLVCELKERRTLSERS